MSPKRFHLKEITMKTSILVTIFIIALGTTFAQCGQQDKTTTAEFKVLGECGMCKSRIEQAAMVDGVSMAVWDVKTKMLTVEYNASIISLEDIHLNIARAGHDTEKSRATDTTYEKLPDCCKYKRSITH
jgi:copper chaperone CopZ